MVAFGEYVDDGTASTMKSRDYKDATDLVVQPITQFEEIAGTLSARYDSSPCADRGQNMVAQPITTYSIMPMNSGKDYKAREVDVAQPIMAGGPVGGNQGGDYIMQSTAVRRLTLRECERLQGFPDDYTAIPKAADGPRYKALGNSMAVPVMAWIGKRIANALA